ncbi:MAG TPA: carboxymuconolactone decarboxylase family protein, partial [Burkholderiales bacterium]|nr:carboxymuconolactone decarboxylase family protein [Burkholderiales bacterium]
MAHEAKRKEELAGKYGAAVIEDAERRHGADFPAIVDWADEIDPHYAKIWLDFTYGGMYQRGVLDERTRTLVVVGQFVAMDELEQLPVYIRAALSAGAAPSEVLEVVLQLGVYVGYPRMVRATRVVKEVMTALGRMDEIRAKQLPIEGPPRESSIEEARAQWQTPPEQQARREELLKKYGWQSLSPGLRLQPTHHVQSA